METHGAFVNIGDKWMNHTFLQEMYIQQLNTEKDVLLKTLEQFLKREPSVDDFSRCSMVYQSGNISKYDLFYDDTRLGTIQKGFSVYAYTVRFTPSKILES